MADDRLLNDQPYSVGVLKGYIVAQREYREWRMGNGATKEEVDKEVGEIFRLDKRKHWEYLYGGVPKGHEDFVKD